MYVITRYLVPSEHDNMMATSIHRPIGATLIINYQSKTAKTTPMTGVLLHFVLRTFSSLTKRQYL